MSDRDAGDGAAAGPGPDAAEIAQRLDRVERSVQALAKRLERMEADLRSAAAAPSMPERDRRMAATPPPPRPAAPSPPHSRAGTPRPLHPIAATARSRLSGMDLESLVGRYGTLALGGLAVILAVGAFLSWAIQRVTIGPEVRVALGAAVAIGFAVVGMRLRASAAEGTRRFGSVLLALALAVTHVVAWGAGPVLGVVPPLVALAVAFAASGALALLAWRSAEQSLFVVGIGGALLAPFVTSAEAGDPLPLLLYGLVVLAAGAAALRDVPWPWATRVLVSGALAYAAAALELSWSSSIAGGPPWVARVAPALFVLACAAAAMIWSAPFYRSVLARLWLLVMLVPLAARTMELPQRMAYWDVVLVAGLGTVAVYVALRLRDARQSWALPSALLQPVLFVAVALMALPRPVGREAAIVTLGAAILAAFAAVDAGLPAALGGWRRAEEADGRTPRWAAHLLVAESAAALTLVLLFRDRPLIGVPLVALFVLAATLFGRQLDRPLALVAPGGILLLATSWGQEQLLARPAWEYVPFLTAASLGALALVVAWAVLGRVISRIEAGSAIGPLERAAAASLGAGAALLWGHEELARAFTPDLSTFLLIAYFAVAGVLLILFGRRRGLPGGRRIGLGLSVYAALKAIVQASAFESIGLRVGSYLLVGGFLLAVAYWYRAAGTTAPPVEEAKASA